MYHIYLKTHIYYCIDQIQKIRRITAAERPAPSVPVRQKRTIANLSPQEAYNWTGLAIVYSSCLTRDSIKEDVQFGPVAIFNREFETFLATKKLTLAHLEWEREFDPTTHHCGLYHEV